jgi:DNA-binding GntR family transcriptional regulator
VVEGDGADGERLLEQLEADLHDTSERADHIARSPHAVDVDHEAGGRPDGVADGLEAIEVAVDLAAACVELEPSVALALLERSRRRGRELSGARGVRLSFESENAWWAARRADADDIGALELLVAETRRLLKQITDDWTPLTEADARWHEALARATKNRLRIGISLGLHEPRLRQVPALGEAHPRYARSIPTALAKITRAVQAHNSDQARSAMFNHVEQWARLNPDVADLASAG